MHAWRCDLSPSMHGNNKKNLLLAEALFLNLQAWCKQHHAKLLIVTTGYNAYFRSPINDPTQQFLTQAPTFFKKNHILFYDIADCFKKKVRGKSFQLPQGDDHPNAFGANAIAMCAWPWLKAQLLVWHHKTTNQDSQ